MGIATTAFLAFSGTALAAGPPEIGQGGEFSSSQPKPSEEVRFEAAINPNEEPTKCDFQYGETAAYGHEAACTEPGETAEGAEQRAAVTVKGLKPGTTYHYRVVLKNASGKAEGPDALVATAPETPETGKANPASITATTATLEDGVLNPHVALGELGEYEYRFKISTTECEGESSTAGMAAGAKEEKVAPVDLTNLQPNATYTFCLFERSLATGQTSAASPPVRFTTKPAPPAIESESTSPYPPSEADPEPRPANEIRLEGLVNANNQLTECHFQYGSSSSVEESTVPCEPPFLGAVFGGQGVGANVGGLSQDTVYHYRILAKNGDGEIKTGKEEEFKTAFTPETPKKAPATGETATTAILHGVLNPASNHESEPGEYQFLYRRSERECHYVFSAAAAKKIEEEIAAAKSAGDEAKVEEKRAKLKDEKAKEAENKHTAQESATGGEKEAVEGTAEGLIPGAYTFCLRVVNSAGEEVVGPPETFLTGPGKPIIPEEALEATNVTASSATLEAGVNPNDAGTTCVFEYGTTTGYAQSVPCSPEPGVGLGFPIEERSPISVSGNLTGLFPSTEYHWRLSATNAAGTTTTTIDQAFGTAAAPQESPVPAIASPVEAVAPPATPTPPAAVPLLSHQSIAELDAKEAQEAKGISTPVITKVLTKAEKLRKALKACRAKKGKQRSKCEAAAHKKFGSTKKKGKK